MDRIIDQRIRSDAGYPSRYLNKSILCMYQAIRLRWGSLPPESFSIASMVRSFFRAFAPPTKSLDGEIGPSILSIA